MEEGTSGYTTGTAAAYTGGTGTSATFNITAKDGKITEVEVNAAGTNYLVEDEITFTGGSGDAKIEVTGVQEQTEWEERDNFLPCLLYTSPSPRDVEESRMPSSA